MFLNTQQCKEVVNISDSESIQCSTIYIYKKNEFYDSTNTSCIHCVQSPFAPICPGFVVQRSVRQSRKSNTSARCTKLLLNYLVTYLSKNPTSAARSQAVSSVYRYRRHRHIDWL